MGMVGLHALASCSAQVPADRPTIEPLTGPWVVAIQPGHWKSEDLPDELYRLRQNSGTAWGQLREVEVNRAVAEALMSMVRARGWTPLLVPATVPPGLRADAFLSIHADGSSDTQRRGWKLAPPWRSSPAGLSLAQSLTQSFQTQTDLAHDESGVTVNMRGYFGFSHRRFAHATSPYTPAVLVELGFLSHAGDRRLLVSDPTRFARILLAGLEAYFESRPRERVDDLEPRVFPRMVVDGSATVVAAPRAGAPNLAQVPQGILINPVGEQGDWYEVSLRNPRVIGWIAKESLVLW